MILTLDAYRFRARGIDIADCISTLGRFPWRTNSLPLRLIIIGASYFACVPNAAIKAGTDGPARNSGWCNVDGWMVEYEAEIHDGQNLQPPRRRYYVHKIIAAAAPDKFYHYVGHHYGNDSWEYEPQNQEAIFHDATETHQWKFNRQFIVRPWPEGSALPGTLPHDSLFLVMPRWPLASYQAPQHPAAGTIFIVSEALHSPSYREEQGSEVIDGHNCRKYVSIRGTDTIWILASNQDCVLRREIRDPKSHRLLQRIITKRINEVGPGLWLPVEFDSTVFLADDARNRGASTSNAMFRILDVRTGDDVPRHLFIPTIKAGSVESTLGGGFRQVSSGGIEYLDEVVRYLREVERLPAADLHRSLLSYRVAWIIAGCFAGIIAGFTFPRFKGRRERRGPRKVSTDGAPSVAPITTFTI